MTIDIPRYAVRCFVAIGGLLGLFLGAMLGMFLLAPALGAEAWWTLGPLLWGCALGGGLAAVLGLKTALRPRADYVSLRRLALLWLGAWLASEVLNFLLERGFGLQLAGAAVQCLFLAGAGVLAVWLDEPAGNR